MPPHHIFGCKSRPRQHYGTLAPPAARHGYYGQQESAGSRARCTAAPQVPTDVFLGGHEREEGSDVALWGREREGTGGTLVLNKEMC